MARGKGAYARSADQWREGRGHMPGQRTNDARGEGVCPVSGVRPHLNATLVRVGHHRLGEGDVEPKHNPAAGVRQVDVALHDLAGLRQQEPQNHLQSMPPPRASSVR
eukprot:1187557-Prorocentrum_minimum.AAC.1